MPSTFTIALRLPEKATQVVHDWYRATFHREVGIKNLHLSGTFGFVSTRLEAGEVVEVIQQFHFSPFTVQLGGFEIYDSIDEMSIAALLFESESARQLMHFHDVLIKHLELNFSSPLEYDLSKYKDGVLPEYEPHVSLEYDLSSKVAEKLKKIDTGIIDIPIVFTQASWVLFEQKNGLSLTHDVEVLPMQPLA